MRASGRVVQRGFSIVEIVIGMTIMSVLVGVTVSTYSDSAQRAREQIALDEARSISSAIQRWQLENQRPYPFDNVLPLVPRFLKRVGQDPWGSQYGINPANRVVYSFGPDGLDDQGEGDDVGFFFDTSGDVAPGPPQNLVVVRQGSDIRVTFQEPTREADGSELGGDLATYRVYIRSATSTQVLTFADIAKASYTAAGQPYPATDIQSLYPTDPQWQDRSYYFTVRAIDTGGKKSVPSNQAGLFLASVVDPEIITFRASSLTPPVSSPFSFFIEVLDSDSNLEEVEIVGFPGGPYQFTTSTFPVGGQPIANPFRYVANFAPEVSNLSPGGPYTVYLRARDANVTVDTQSNPLTIEVINNPPLIPSLSPGIKLLTQRNLGDCFIRVDYEVEATDAESNLSRLDVTVGGTLEASYDLDPAGAVMIRSFSHDFDACTVGDVDVVFTAHDTEGESFSRTSKVEIRADNTAPDALNLSIDPSNKLLATSAYEGIWWVPTVDQMRVYLEAFEIESPPVSYFVRIAEGPLNTAWHSLPLASVITEDSGDTDNPGWYHIQPPFVPPQTAEDYLLTPGAGLAANFTETTSYSIGMRATNSAGLTNYATAAPLSLNLLFPQNTFRVDATPPTMQPGDISILGQNNGSFLWINDTLNVEWVAPDPVGGVIGNPDASGADRYRYRVSRRVGASPKCPCPLYDWTEVQTTQLQAIDLPSADLSDNGVIVEVEILARDLAGNWMTTPETASARVDFTPPTLPGIPTITNQEAGVIPVLDTLSASWGPENAVLRDDDSGIESYEWGIASTSVLPPNALPDIFGWIPVLGSSFTSGTISLNNLLTDGDTVHAMVRAYNFAGSVSNVTPSTPSVVNVNLRTTFSATPRSGLEPLLVKFKGEVEGGDPPYDYRFQFNGTSVEEYAIFAQSSTSISTSFTYDSSNANLDRPEVARLIVTDSAGRVSQKDLVIDYQQDVLGFATFDNERAYTMFRLTASAVEPLMVRVLDAGPGEGPWSDLFVEPRGNFLVGIDDDLDTAQFARTEFLPNGTIQPSFSTPFGGISTTPEVSTMVFDPNQPRGVLVQTFRNALGPCLSNGFIRTKIFDTTVSGASPPDERFGCGPTFGQPIRYYGAVGDPNNLSRGAALYQAAPPAANDGDFLMKQFSGVGSSTAELDAAFSATSIPLTTNVATAGIDFGIASNPVGNPRNKTKPVASGAGYYLAGTNTNAPLGIMRVDNGSAGMGATTLLSPSSAGDPVGMVELNGDGRFFTALQSPTGDGSNWSVGIGFVDQPTYDPGVAGVAGTTARHIDMDEGGSRIAVSLNNQTAAIYTVDFSGVNPVVVAPPGQTVNFPTLLAGMGFGGDLSPSAVRLVQRPNNGFPAVYAVYERQDANVDNTDAGTDRITRGSTALIIKGVNLDRLAPASAFITRDSNGVTCGPFDYDLVGNVPPGPGYGGLTHIPARGNIYNFARVDLQAPATAASCYDGLVTGAENNVAATFEIRTPQGSATIDSAAAFNIDGS